MKLYFVSAFVHSFAALYTQIAPSAVSRGSGTFLAIHLTAALLVTCYAVYLFAHIVYSRYLFIRLGRPGEENVKAEWRARLKRAAAQMFGHGTLLQDWRSGLMHLVIFYGFIMLQLGALDLILQGINTEWHLPIGGVYPWFELSQEIVVLLVMAAVMYAAYRRYVEKLSRLKKGWGPAIVLLFISGLMLSVVFTLSAKRAWLGETASGYQPLASAVATWFEPLGEAANGVMFYAGWWSHLLILLAFLVYVPQSKHAHLLFAPVNLFLRSGKPAGRLEPVDLEDENAESFGAGKVEHFTRNQLTDLYACVECGRCTSSCPASGTGKMLSPMHLIIHMRNHLTHKGAAITSRTPWMPAFAFSSTAENRAASEGKGPNVGGTERAEFAAELLGDTVTEQELWACTTCRNCEDQCPVANEHVSFIVDMRRYLVLTQGSLPAEAGRTLTNIERQGNPWGLSRQERARWKEGLDAGEEAPAIQEGKPFDYLFYIGSMGAYDKRCQKITRAFIKIMNRAGISFAVLGNEETNSGDTARRLGNEFLFQELARANIELFDKYGVRKIITIDPHAYNTFKNEYPDFGLSPDVEVYHHSELIAKWLKEARIAPAMKLAERVTYHDSCYLGRYNGIYGGPREILESVPGLEVAEMERSGRNSMCCGAGGGRMWMEENEGKRVNVARTEQALAVKPTIIGTACPYCLTMMSDGTKALEADDRVRTMDVAEIVAASLE
ncbi:(Fe-S)-binding protein [Paenibacillus sp. MBLB4367]|uniref:(Fe-S)-binding protein n=1 Tax=Paenibacillus sp. MBLB4367 TaxID=3384767 RepID=UPI0039080677